MRRCPSFALSLTLLAAAACGPTSSGDDTGGGGDDDGTPDGGTIDADPTGGGGGGGGGGDEERCEKIDILFVVDDSGSMAQEQANLGMNFPGFIDVIQDSGLDYRVAVTTTGVDYTYFISTPIGNIESEQDGGDNGAMRMNGACQMSRRWIEQADSDPAGTFACVANVGTTGPADEMPLAAMRMALEDRMQDGTNQGWRRDDALLAIVFLTDENDCSYEQAVTLGFTETLCNSQMEPVANYVAFLDQYTGDRARWAAAAIAGDADCSSDFGDADYAERLDQFIQQTGANGVLSSICSGDLTTGLADALAVFSSACEGFPPID